MVWWISGASVLVDFSLLTLTLTKTDIKVIQLVEKGYTHGCLCGVAGLAVGDGLYALPHALGIGVGKVFLHPQLVLLPIRPF